MADITLSRMKFGWSRWGGGNQGLMQENQEEWFCQTCGEKQTNDLPTYLVRADESQREFGKVCSVCLSIAIFEKINSFLSLSARLKVEHEWW